MSTCSGSWLFYAAVVVVLLHFYFAAAAAAFSSGITPSNETDRMALLEFKAMISDDPSGVLSSWNDSTHFCQWYGVSCSTRHVGRVKVLDLGSQELLGSISPHIGNLSFLTELFLFNNSFTKGIPPEIGRLHRLQRLYLFNNSFSGEIPSNISGCSALAIFHVGNNKLTGQLPWQIGSLSKLKFLMIAMNNLRGSIPSSVGNLSSLQTFQAYANNLDGRVPGSLGQLKILQELVLQRNHLSGEIPASIFNLSALINLYLGGNQLHGELPTNLGTSLPNLHGLDVSYNQFTGTVPSSLSNASNLIALQLQVNSFTGSMPSMENSHNLADFFINSNSLGSGKEHDLAFLSSLTNASKLRRLVINRNKFGGCLPEQIGNLSTSLEILSLSTNNLSGRIPSGIQNLVNLHRLEASGNHLSGIMPSIFQNMQALKWLDLSNNNISGSIPLSIGNLTKLLKLYLNDNHLLGEIPATIENCRDLMVLEFSNNDLSGVIPSQLMGLTSFFYLNFSYNHLTGSLPVEVGSLINLEDLDVSHNMISGEIPSSLADCMALESLNLQGNLLEGTLPPSLTTLRGIQQLDISSNKLSGQIPELFASMNQLQLLNLSYNNFEGEVSSSGVFRNVSIISVIGNDKLCGGVVELNLAPCNFKHQKKTLNHRLKIGISIICGMLLFTLVGSCLLIFWKKRKQDTVLIDDLQVSYHNLFKCTNGFAATHLIGAGGFGSVYKGILEVNGIETTVAVKVFNLRRHGASKSFMAECAALKNIRHRNLVKILTVCSSVDYQGNDFKALIYEFLAHGSLEDWLHPMESREEPSRRLNFFQRLNIGIDIVSAVDYLHHQCETPIVHCDLKPNNVLLDEDMVAHVGDFGLARFIKSIPNPSSIGQASSSIGIKGTVGYAPPEYGMGHDVSTHGDLYSYGVLLLEMFTGRRPTDDIFKEDLNIHRFVKNALSRQQAEEVVDPILLDELLTGQTTHSNTISSRGKSVKTSSMKGQVLENVLIPVLEIGVACSSDFPHERISTSEVVARLVSLRKLLLSKSSQRQREVN